MVKEKKDKSGLLLPIYCVFDKISEIYDTPFFSRDDIFAKRRFILWSQDSGNMIHNFPFDFELYRVGTFNCTTGHITPEYILIIEGDQVVKKEEEK